jgi:hypothetical protein
LRILEADGTETESTIDGATLIEWSRRERSPGDIWKETRFKNYRKVGAANIAFVQEKWQDGRLRATTRIAELNADPGLLDQFFSMPAESTFDFMHYMAVLAAPPPNAGNGARP